jgi:hypothetical protein
MVNKEMETNEWKLVKVYECPDCGEWVKDMDDACNHVCKLKRSSEETVKKLELLREIGTLREELKSTPFYKFSKRRDIKLKLWELDGKRLYGHVYDE